MGANRGKSGANEWVESERVSKRAREREGDRIRARAPCAQWVGAESVRDLKAHQCGGNVDGKSREREKMTGSPVETEPENRKRGRRAGSRHRRWVERAPLDFCNSKTAEIVRLGLVQLASRLAEQAKL